EKPVIGGDAAPRAHILERLEFRQLELRQRLRIADELEHLLAPLRVEALPVLVIIEGSLLELLGPARNLGRVRDGVAADIDAAVEDAMIDAERRRQAMDAGVRG